MSYSNGKYTCGECGKTFSNRKLLRDHKIENHYDLSNLQDIPWGVDNPSPFDYSGDITDLFVMSSWFNNRFDILEPHDVSDSVVASYNFPLKEDRAFGLSKVDEVLDYQAVVSPLHAFGGLHFDIEIQTLERRNHCR